MVWFVCDNCGDSIKKPKLQQHFYSCGSHSFACVDCNRSFDRNTAQGHSTCVTEHEKYAQGATKPGGYAANGYNRDNPAAAASNQGSGEATGLEFLTNRPPWKCSVCNVACTSKETLMSHASGVKHKRRAKAALNAQALAAGEGRQLQRVGGRRRQRRHRGNRRHRRQRRGALLCLQQRMASTSTQQGTTTTTATTQPYTDDQLAKLIKVVSKKLKTKGKVGPKKLRVLVCKKFSVEEDSLGALLMDSIRDKIVAMGIARADGKKLLPAQ